MFLNKFLFFASYVHTNLIAVFQLDLKELVESMLFI